MMADIEIKALAGIAAILEPLDRQQTIRVLDWAKNRYADGPHDRVHEIFKAWTDEIVAKAQTINVEPRIFQQAVLSLMDLVEQEQQKAACQQSDSGGA